MIVTPPQGINVEDHQSNTIVMINNTMTGKNRIVLVESARTAASVQ